MTLAAGMLLTLFATIPHDLERRRGLIGEK